MSQVSSTMRKVQGGFAHWCPGCEEMHILPDSWNFNGNLESPSFTPSFKHEGIQRVFQGGNWTGEWKRDANGNVIPVMCHYVLTNGRLEFQSDCTHSLANQTVPLPPLPGDLRDE